MPYTLALGPGGGFLRDSGMRFKRAKKAMIAGLSLGVLLLALLAFRLYLPTLVLHAVNRKLAALDGYEGRVGKVELSLWRGACRVEDVRIVKEGLPLPFFRAEAIEGSLRWRALLRRRIVAEVAVLSPRMNIVKAAEEGKLATEPNESFTATLRSLTPIKIDRLRVQDGEVRYLDYGSDPKVNIALTEIEATARNLRNTERGGAALPADIRVRARAFGTGTLTIALKAAPLKEAPTFELKQTLSGVELAKLSDFFEAYAKFRVKSGQFGLYAEVAAKEGKFIGYAKPFMKDMKIDKKAGGSAGKQLWAVVVDAAKWLFSNKRKDTLATKFPIEGTFEKAEVGLWSAVAGVLRNAYVKALTPGLEGAIDLKDVDKVEKP